MIAFDSRYTFTNNTVCHNRTGPEPGTHAAGILIFEGTGVATGVNNILYGNEAIDDPNFGGNINFTYSCVEDGMPGEGNITEDPLFVDPANDDYHLQEGSPCINTGDPGSPLDPDSTRADMGAFYYPVNTIDDEFGSTVPTEFNLHGCYPNPFNPAATIAFSLPQRSHVTLSVYDLNGSLVSTLIRDWRSAGKHEVAFAASGLASGIYLYRLSSPRSFETGKMILIK